MPSIVDFSGESQVVVKYQDRKSKDVWEFECDLPTTRMKSKAVKAAQNKRGGGMDLVLWNKSIFEQCVQGWNLDEECTTANKAKFFADDSPGLNVIGEEVVNSLLEFGKEEEAKIEGN